MRDLLVGRTALIALGVVRLVLGGLWLREGVFKLTAHFGRADILLVADGAAANSRVPRYVAAVADGLLRRWPGLFGTAVPLVEIGIGMALILGVFTVFAAAISMLTLMTYWGTDQLIAQFPVMGALSVVILVWPAQAARLSTWQRERMQRLWRFCVRRTNTSRICRDTRSNPTM